MRPISAARRLLLKMGLYIAVLSGIIPRQCPAQAEKTAQQESPRREIILFAADSTRLAATFVLPEGGLLPAVLLIHQGGSDRHEWDFLLDSLVQRQFAALSLDLRGHGESDPLPDIIPLFNDPRQAPLDVEAALHFLKSQPRIDSTRIAIVGASIGGNLACVASSRGQIASGVVLSAKTSAVTNLAGADSLHFRSLFVNYLAFIF